MRLIRFAMVLPVLLLTGCAGGGGGLGAIGDILGTLGGVGTGGAGGAQQGELRGEVQSVDSGTQLIYLRTLSGESGSLRYDQRTQVVYQQQQYPVTALERGDLVTIQAQQTGNELYAASVFVEQSAQERAGNGGTGGAGTNDSRTLYRLDGQVTQVDLNQGWFQLRTSNQGVLTVSLPYNVDRATVDRFQRLRSGDYVGVEGYMLNQQRVELYRFR